MAQAILIFDTYTSPMPEFSLAEGFSIRPFKADDFDSYNALRMSVGFSRWDDEKMTGLQKSALPDGILLITENNTGKIVSSASATKRTSPEFSSIGILDWVMTDPDFSGKHLGRSAVIAAMQHLARYGYQKFYVTTQTHRIAALKTYLFLHWQPLIKSETSRMEWENAVSQTGRSLSEYSPLSELP